MIEIQEQVLRMCRIGGRKPSARDKWQAFWRLWRLANAKDPGGHAINAFRTLMADWRWLRLADSPGDKYESLRFMPKDIRWHNLRRRGPLQKTLRIPAGDSCGEAEP